jgi:hypothetical protein
LIAAWAARILGPCLHQCSTCDALDDGTRLYDVAGGSMRQPRNLVGDDPNAVTNLRFRTTYEN